MKVIDLTAYRSRRELERLEEKIGQLALASRAGSVREIKTCFREWLRMSSR